MSVEAWVAVIVAVAGALGLREMIPGAARWLSGGADREKARVQQIIAERDAESARADREARARRKLEEYASTLRRDLIDAGIEPDQITPWPT